MRYKEVGRYAAEEVRFWRQVKFMPSGCWEWQACLTPAGYGQLGRQGGGLIAAHRFAYERTMGPIPKGLFVMHTCDNPPCVRVAHLRLGTHAENMADSKAKGRNRTPRADMLRALTHCMRGHEFTPENTIRTKVGTRNCRTCKGNWQRADRAKRAEMEAAENEAKGRAR